jgi:hypothetical protein
MPSKQALARRQKFADAKKQAGGYDALREESKNLPVLIYFDEKGDIKGVSKTPIPDKDWKHFAFTEEQVSILTGQNTNHYKITQDLKESTLYHLERKPVEEVYVRSETDALSVISKSKARKYDIKVELKDNALWTTMHTSCLDQYKDIDSEAAVIKGKKTLTFYITAIGDPHFLFKQVSVELRQLLENKTVQIVLPEQDYTKTDIYTTRLFTKYIRT